LDNVSPDLTVYLSAITHHLSNSIWIS
jgi:hypothetical protein